MTGLPNPDRLSVAVFTVDDQPVFRQVAREVIEATPGFVSAGEASSGQEALRLVSVVNPHLILMDVRMPQMDGFETASLMSAVHPAGVIVLISVDDVVGLASRVAHCGAVEFIRKQDFGPMTLRRLWTAHGLRPAAEAGLD